MSERLLFHERLKHHPNHQFQGIGLNKSIDAKKLLLPFGVAVVFILRMWLPCNCVFVHFSALCLRICAASCSLFVSGRLSPSYFCRPFLRFYAYVYACFYRFSSKRCRYACLYFLQSAVCIRAAVNRAVRNTVLKALFV